MQPQEPYRQPSLFSETHGIRHPDVSLVSFPTSGTDIHSDSIQSLVTYGHAPTRFGMLTLASADGCIVHAHLGDTEADGLASLQRMYPNGGFQISNNPNLPMLVRFLEVPTGPVTSFRVAVSGTPFLMEVWQALLRIPFGCTLSYAQLASMVGRPDAVRAVGTAVGRNPVAYLIPCHRVVQTGGGLGGYMWGVERKRKLLEWEASLSLNIH